MSDPNNPSGGPDSRPVSRSTQTGTSSDVSGSTGGSSSAAGGNRGGGRGNRILRSPTPRLARLSRATRSSASRLPRRSRAARSGRSRSATSRPIGSGGSPRSNSAGGGSGSDGIPHRSPTLINDTETICPICHNQITNLCITDCNHRFCRDCIRRWTMRNATCPSCRTNIRTIRHILPDGGTETILISRAELLAHKVNEIHSILMILFTVISHTLLPEVSNYLDQLNQIARELNVPTTSSRMENVAATAEAAAAEMATTNSPAAAGSAGAASTLSSPGPQASQQASQPASEPTSRPASSTVSSSGSSPSSSQASQPTSRPASSTINSSGSSPSSSQVSSRASQLPSQTANQTASQQSQAPPPGGACDRLRPSPLSSAGLRGAIGGGLVFAPRQTAGGSSQLSSATSGTAAMGPDSAYSSSVSDNPNIRHTYLAANQSAATNPAATASTLSPPAQQSPQHQRLSFLSARNLILRAAASRGQAPATPILTRQTGQQQATIDRTLGARSQPPSPAELVQAQEQRQRDIRFLTDSFNKINQVYEVLMIMHMVIHRNQVESDPLPSRSSSNAADSDSGSDT